MQDRIIKSLEGSYCCLLEIGGQILFIFCARMECPHIEALLSPCWERVPLVGGQDLM